MKKPKYHILICSSSRLQGEAKGACKSRGSGGFFPYVEEELSDRGIEGVLLSNTGCLKLCDEGPAMVIYPQGWWYTGLTEEKIDQILDALEEGDAATDLLA